MLLRIQQNVLSVMIENGQALPSMTAREIADRCNKRYGTKYRPDCLERYLQNLCEGGGGQVVRDERTALIQRIGDNGTARYCLTRLGVAVVDDHDQAQRQREDFTTGRGPIGSGMEAFVARWATNGKMN